MMRFTLLLTVFALGGCAVLQHAPTLKYCDSVKYERTGREITITAHCFEAVESMMPLPMPAPLPTP